MAYIRSHETKQRARGKAVKTYAVVYRAKVRTEEPRGEPVASGNPRHEGRC